MALELARKTAPFIEKILTSNKSSTNNGTISELTVSGLTIGKYYEVKMTCTYSFASGGLRSARLEAKQGAVFVGTSSFQNNSSSASNVQFTTNFTFLATATSLIFNLVALDTSSILAGSGSDSKNLGTFVQVYGPLDITTSSAMS